jgi:hypothetical protein
MIPTPQRLPQDSAAAPRPVPSSAAWTDTFALRVWLACCLFLWAIAASNWLASLWRG